MDTFLGKMRPNEDQKGRMATKLAEIWPKVAAGHEKGRISGLAEAADLLEGLNLAKSSKSGIGWERLEQAGFGAEPQ